MKLMLGLVMGLLGTFSAWAQTSPAGAPDVAGLPPVDLATCTAHQHTFQVKLKYGRGTAGGVTYDTPYADACVALRDELDVQRKTARTPQDYEALRQRLEGTTQAPN